MSRIEAARRHRVNASKLPRDRFLLHIVRQLRPRNLFQRCDAIELDHAPATSSSCAVSPPCPEFPRLFSPPPPDPFRRAPEQLPQLPNHELVPAAIGATTRAEDALRQRIVAKFTEVAGVLIENRWRMPAEPPFNLRGSFHSFNWSGAPRLLFVCKAMQGSHKGPRKGPRTKDTKGTKVERARTRRLFLNERCQFRTRANQLGESPLFSSKTLCPLCPLCEALRSSEIP